MSRIKQFEDGISLDCSRPSKIFNKSAKRPPRGLIDVVLAIGFARVGFSNTYTHRFDQALIAHYSV